MMWPPPSSPDRKVWACGAIAILPRCRMDAQRQADRIDGGIQLGRQAAARTTNGALSGPFFAVRIGVDIRDRAVDHHIFEVRRVSHGMKKPLPYPMRVYRRKRA